MNKPRPLVLALAVGVGLALIIGWAALCAQQRAPHEAQGGGVVGAFHSTVLFADSAVSFLKATQQIQVFVQSNAVRIPATGYYRYTYTVQNEPISTNSITRFGVAPLTIEPLTVQAPDHWSAFWGYEDVNNAVVWAVTDSGVPPPGWGGSQNNIYPSGYEIQAGQTQVFSFETPVPPLTDGAMFYAQGFDTLQGGMESVNDDLQPPTLFQEGVTGLVVAPGSPVGVEGQTPPERIEVRSPIPNPSLSTVAITFGLPREGRVGLGVYDVSGRNIRQLVERLFPAGLHSITWDGRDRNGRRVAPGVYFYKLSVDGRAVGERRVVILQ